MRVVTTASISSALIVGAGLLVAGAAKPAMGAAIAADNAANAPYGDGWNSGDNGGTGFGPWGFSNGSKSGFFIGSSSANGSPTPSGNIDTSGVSWGMFANSGDSADAYRPLTGGTLGVGQTFKIDMDNGWVDSGGTVGFGLMDANGNNQLEFFFVNGASDYTIHDSGGTRDSGVGYTEGGLHLAFTLLSATTYSGTITVGSTTTPVAGTLIGSGNITQVHLFNANAGSGDQPNLYFNSMAVVPEPASLGLLLLGGMGALAVRRRRTA